MDIEEWKPVHGYEGFYEISNHGRVKSLERMAGHRFKPTAIISPYIHTDLYKSISMSKGEGKHNNYLVHKLVAYHFIPNPNNYRYINHKDGNKSNCHHSNLEWCTQGHNVKHAYDTGLIGGPKKDVSALKKKMEEYVRKSDASIALLTEKFLPVVGYEGLYEVSDYGRVKKIGAFKYSKHGFSYKRPDFILKGHKSRGYNTLRLSKDGVVKHHLIHRLEAIAHIPNPENKPQVNHKGGDKMNNMKWNLEWHTAAENVQHTFTHLGRKPVILKGEKASGAKYTENEILYFRKYHEDNLGRISLRKMARNLNVVFTTFHQIVKRKIWSHI